jgi:hypothetical protein
VWAHSKSSLPFFERRAKVWTRALFRQTGIVPGRDRRRTDECVSHHAGSASQITPDRDTELVADFGQTEEDTAEIRAIIKARPGADRARFSNTVELVKRLEAKAPAVLILTRRVAPYPCPRLFHETLMARAVAAE